MNRKLLMSIPAVVFISAVSVFLLLDHTSIAASPDAKILSAGQTSPIIATPSATPTDTPMSVEQTTDAFYDHYLNCLKNASGTDYCISHDPYRSSNFSANLGASLARVGDPVTCSENMPETIGVDHATVPQDGKSTAYVMVTNDDGSVMQIIANVVLENGLWKIDSIFCPRPS